MRCSYPWCPRGAKHKTLALCAEHARPHMKECKARKASPFRPPVQGQATEIQFNKTKWLWWRGCWRMTQG